MGVTVRIQPRSSPGPLLALDDLMRRPYFKRMLIIQEVSSARNLTIFCGQLQMILETFNQGMAFGQQHGIVDNRDGGLGAICRESFGLRDAFGIKMSLLYLLELFDTAWIVTRGTRYLVSSA